MNVGVMAHECGSDGTILTQLHMYMDACVYTRTNHQANGMYGFIKINKIKDAQLVI